MLLFLTLLVGMQEHVSVPHLLTMAPPRATLPFQPAARADHCCMQLQHALWSLRCRSKWAARLLLLLLLLLTLAYRQIVNRGAGLMHEAGSGCHATRLLQFSCQALAMAAAGPRF